MPTRCNRGFYCRSYCLLYMFRAPLWPSSEAEEYYTVVAASGILCCKNFCCIQLAFYFHILTTMHDQNHIKFISKVFYTSVFKYHYRSTISLYITVAYILSVRSLNHCAPGSLLPRTSGMCVLTVKYMSSTDFAISILPLHSKKIRFSRFSSVGKHKQ